MKFLFPLALIFTLATTNVSLPAFPSPVPIVGEYLVLYELCNNNTDAYVGVKYCNDTMSLDTTFSFNECYHYSTQGMLAEMAVFCRSATCYNNPNPDCTGGAVPPVPVLIPDGTTLINVADFVQYLGQGATCQKNGLP